MLAVIGLMTIAVSCALVMVIVTVGVELVGAFEHGDVIGRRQGFAGGEKIEILVGE
jgi:hypothetical protein